MDHPLLKPVPSEPCPPDVAVSVIIPVFNGQGWIGRCITHVVTAVQRAELGRAEVIVIDDGSQDATVAEAQAALQEHPGVELIVIEQPNSGRFAARRRGLEVAKFPHVLFIDTRVFLDPDALAFVVPFLSDPDRQVWTSHVEAVTDENPIAGFWQAIEHVAWRRYFRTPRTTSFGIDEFDYYPKGTTALLAPRDLLIEAFDSFDPTVGDWHKVNDDTAVLRWVAERTPINISPGYSSRYNARTDLVPFLKHAEHRGTVLIDGYLRSGTRFAAPIAGVLFATPGIVWFTLRHPIRAAALALAGAIAAATGARALGARSHDAKVLGMYSVPFGVAYLAGMWRGFFLRFVWLRRRAAGTHD